jgi:perosamine synthetase
MTGLPSDQDASGRSFGDRERELLNAVVAAGILSPTRGTMVHRFEEHVAALLGVDQVVACSSGTAAMHTAVAALDLEPGDEVITTPLTDFGGIAPILWQGCIPRFVDVDPLTLNITAATVAEGISPRTRAIVVTHLFGNPADLGPILDVAAQHQVAVIEDCCQAYGARYRGRHVGSLGDLSAFSLQQTKHITTGEGGLVATSSEPFGNRVHQFVNKARDYGDAVPDHHFLAMNYRMTELQGAVGVAQIERLDELLARRVASASSLAARVDELAGLCIPPAGDGNSRSWWRFTVHVDPREVPGGASALTRELAAREVPFVHGYQPPAYTWRFIRERRTFGTSGYPFTLADPDALDYRPQRFPGVCAGNDRIMVMPWSERLGPGDIDLIGASLEAAHAACCRAAVRG